MNMMYRFNVIFAIICILCNCNIEIFASNCFLQKTCSSCVEDHDCVWCSQQVFQYPFNRCESKSAINSINWCEKTQTWDWTNLMNSQCPCDQPGHLEFEKNSIKCGGYGDYKCGVCSCYPGHLGQFCECDFYPFQTVAGIGSEDSCKMDNSSLVCSGRGQCICGECDCLKSNIQGEEIYGKFCQCDNFSCKRHNGELCGGKDRGSCICKKCKCQLGWSGPDCSCSDTTVTCISPLNGEICSGKGKCVCGKCNCHSGRKYKYQGEFCEEKVSIL